jgi:hypothetical protein
MTKVTSVNSGKTIPTEAAAGARVRTAFLLGWSVSETLGRLRKGVRPPPQPSAPATDNAPRLVVADGAIDKTTDAFEFAAQRIVQFYRELAFEIDDEVSPLTKEINALPEKTRAWLEGKTTDFYSQGALRELLNDWSLQVWGRLDGESADCARAFTSGMSLADTFWYLRQPKQRPKGLKPAQSKQEDWRRLLSKFRLDVERSRLQGLADNLPRYVAAVIQKELEAWSIGTQLVYQGDTLVRDKQVKKSPDLKPADEEKLYQALERQTQNWEAMLFGLRESTTFLWASDQWKITWWRRSLLFLVLLATALSLVAASVALGYFFAFSLGPLLSPFLAQQGIQVSDWVAILGLLWTVLVALPTPLVLRAVYQGTRDVQQRLDDWLTVSCITRRTLIPWNYYF